MPSWDFPGGPVGKNLLPMQGTWVQSLVGELRPPHAAVNPELCNYRAGLLWASFQNNEKARQHSGCELLNCV